MGEYSIQIAHSVDEIGRQAWDSFSEGRPFASYRWMRFGETVMADCAPTHVTLHLDNQPIARATFWRIAAEPLPLPPLVRTPVAALLRSRPLVICRAPLANWTGLLLPDESSLRSKAREAFLEEGLRLLNETRGSYLIFDFLDMSELIWPAGVTVTAVSDAGTRLDIRWRTFEEFLASTDKRGRQHYKRVLRSATDLHLSHYESVADVDAALSLIHQVERKHGAAFNPWMRGLLKNAASVGGIWQEVRQHGRLVACGMLLEDNGVLVATALGLAEDVPYAYFLLIYAALEKAIERGAHTLRFGSGAYDVKRRLGFELEDNNHSAIATHSPFLRRLAKWMA